MFQVHVRLCVTCRRLLVRTSHTQPWEPYQGTLTELGYKHQILSVHDFECGPCLTKTLDRVAKTAGATS